MTRLFKFNSRHLKKTIALTAALAMVQAPFAISAQARVKVGVTSAVIPEAMMGNNSNRLKTVTVGAKVDQDVLIETGARGRTQVLFIDGSSINIGPSSRLIIDEFVFDPGQLSGNLGAKLEKGSMRFIGGVLSKRAGQVEFNAGEATVGIRGGIAKIAVEADGKMLAQLVHGRISVQTPEGLFETDRIGTQIERAADGAVATRTLTVEETKSELDEEAKENEEEVPAEIEDTQAETENATATASQADQPADDTDNQPANEQTEKEITGDVLVDNPVENGLVEVDAEGNLKASAELVEIDPEAAKLIDEGALVVTEDGSIAPTAKILEFDDTAQQMFEDGLLKVDEDGLLVPNEEFGERGFFNAENFVETEDKTVSDETLADFGLAAPSELSREDTYKSNLMMTRVTLKADPTTAKLLEVGQLEIDGESGLLKPSQNFSPLRVARTDRATSRFESSIVKDDIADRILLSAGVFDTKDTTRVVGAELASSFYSEPVVTIVKRDIVRDDAINAIERLAGTNDVELPNDIKTRSLDELVSIGGALSTRDALKAVTTKETEFYLPDVTIGEKGSDEVVSVSVSEEAATALNLPKDETDVTQSLIDSLLSSGMDSGFVDSLVNALGDGQNQPTDSGLRDAFDDGKSEQTDSGLDTSTYDEGATFTEPFKEENAENYGNVKETGLISFIGGLGGEFNDDDTLLKVVGISTTVDDAPYFDAGEPYYETPAAEIINVTPENPTEEVAERQEDVAEAERGSAVEEYELWKLNISGQRAPTGRTKYGDYVVSDFWEAYDSSYGLSESYIVREADNSVAVSFDVNTYSVYGTDPERRYYNNRYVAASQTPSGEVTNLLALNNFSFKAAVEALAGYRLLRQTDKEPAEQKLTFKANDMNTMVREARSINADVNICSDCDQVATGIWENENFVNASLDNITYQHKGHWAIGQPLSSDTLRRLAGMKISFEGHAVGTVVTSTLNETGYGTVTVNVDFANPRSGTANTFQIRDFRSENYDLGDTPNFSLELNSENGHFSGNNWQDDIVDGAVYGTYEDPQNHNLQTAGSFALNRSDASITGSFAAKATSVSE